MTMLSICIFLTIAIASSLGQLLPSVPGVPAQISAKANELWAINSGGDIFRWTGTAWEQKRGWASSISAASDGWAWHVGTGGGIWRWNVDKGDWEGVPGNKKMISSWSKDLAIGVNNAGEVWLWQSGSWSQVGSQAKWASVGEGGERWMVLNEGSIWRWENDHWERQVGRSDAETIDVQSANRIVMTNKDKNIFLWRGGEWQELLGLAQSATISNTHIYSVSPIVIQATQFQTCQDIFNVKSDTQFDDCSVDIKVVLAATSDQCCDLCIATPKESGCYYDAANKECNICAGRATGHSDSEGNTLFVRKNE